MIQKAEPDYLVMELDRNANNFFALDGYEYLINKHLPLMVKSTNGAPEIVNIFETESGKKVLETLRRYYLAGYINEDAAAKPLASLEHGKKVFFRVAGGGPYSDVVWSEERGYPVVATMKSEPVVTTENTRAGVMCVSARTAYPEECVKFLNCLNTDAEVRNLLNYGVEGIHYQLNETNQVEFIAIEQYSGVQYTQGNWFILYTRAGEPAEKWDVFRQHNANTVKSDILGFTPNVNEMKYELDTITKINDKYYASLMTGSVDTEKYLNDFNAALHQAGLDEVQQKLQNQLYECVGDVPNVTFPCAALADPETGRIALYYGCADTVTSLAFTTVDRLLAQMKTHPLSKQ